MGKVLSSVKSTCLIQSSLSSDNALLTNISGGCETNCGTVIVTQLILTKIF